MRSSLRVAYADPAGVGNVVLGAEARTARTDFDLKRPVAIIDVTALTVPAGADDHLFSVRRLNGQITDMFTWTQILAANANTIKPTVAGKGIGTGTIQFIIEEIVAAAAGVSVLWTFDKPLIG